MSYFPLSGCDERSVQNSVERSLEDIGVFEEMHNRVQGGYIMSATLTIHLSTDQLYDIVNHMNSEERQELVRRLDELVWGERFGALLSRFDDRLEKCPISEAEILREVKAVREERYVQSRD